ncbi:hypothetical protein GA0061101_10677 [Rhizobium lusitanum]|uniref:HNH endonuclease n=1 Tax=Rhizobium lusitanum TaxID=293958 RepID=A0A1C3VR87_9HYPH|nr:hypothetical protein GA0061101_10677 [Rhizobium lusitanum]
MANLRVCSIHGCGNRYYGRKLCNKHWQRLRKHGDPLVSGTTPRNPIRYIHEIVLSYDGDECLLWPFGRMSNGYGLVRVDGNSCLASRVVCEHVHGAPPTPTHEAAHSCGKGHLGCVTKRHLSWKTSTENKADMLIHGTRLRGSAHGGSKITEKIALEIRSLRGKVPQANLVARFGISQTTISRIQNGERWAWLE